MFGPQPNIFPNQTERNYMNDPKPVETIEGPLDLSKSEKIESIKRKEMPLMKPVKKSRVKILMLLIEKLIPKKKRPLFQLRKMNY